MTVYVRPGEKLNAHIELRKANIKGIWSPFANGGWTLMTSQMNADDVIWAILKLR